MVALRICTFTCTLREQVPNENVFIKTVSVKYSNLRPMFGYNTQESMSFIIATLVSKECNEKLIQHQKPQLQIGFKVP